jgi:hypothetical protein
MTRNGARIESNDTGPELINIHDISRANTRRSGQFV